MQGHAAGGALGAAAAAAVNMDFSQAQAAIAPGAVITAGGAVTVQSSLDGDADANASGEA